MMYINQYGLWDVKPGDDDEATGNDGWILTAYAAKVGLHVHHLDIYETFWLTTDDHGFPIMRLPGKPTPPPSRDVMLGMMALGFLPPHVMEKKGWNFSPYPLPRFNPFKLISQLWKLRGKHRNTFWKEPGYEQVFRVAFMVPFQDRGSYYRAVGARVPFLYKIIEAIDLMLEPSSDSSRLLRWVKYDKWPDVGTCERYFGKDHPITKVIVDETF